MSLKFLSGVPGQVYITRAGTHYTADTFGVVTVSTPPPDVDVLDLMNQGLVSIGQGGTLLVAAGVSIGTLTAANMNVTTDQAFVMSGWSALHRFRITKITAENASISLTTAAGGIYPAISKGGTAVVAAGQVYSNLTTANLALDLTLAVGTTVYAAGSLLYLSLTTPQGAAATVGMYVFGDLYL